MITDATYFRFKKATWQMTLENLCSVERQKWEVFLYLCVSLSMFFYNLPLSTTVTTMYHEVIQRKQKCHYCCLSSDGCGHLQMFSSGESYWKSVVEIQILGTQWKENHNYSWNYIKGDLLYSLGPCIWFWTALEQLHTIAEPHFLILPVRELRINT